MTQYADCLAYLYRQLPMFQRIGVAAYKKDLGNTLALLDFLGNPQTKFKSIHIAGTNGKGSSAHTLAAIFQAAGYKTGLYTSPHLKEFTERIKINGKEIPKERVVAFVEETQEQLELIKPSFFEVTVCMAFQYFAIEEVDIAIVETGLGGRLDSTNVIMPEISLITNIGMDHTELLGNTLAAIAGEKAGIIKSRITVVIGTLQEETWPVFVEKAQAMNAPIMDANTLCQVEQKTDEVLIKWHNPEWEISVVPEIKAAYYLKNLPGIIATISRMQEKGWDIGLEAIKEGIAQVVKLTGLKGRFQVLQPENPTIIADISHNKDGILSLFSQVDQLVYNHLHIIFGMVQDKEAGEILSVLPKNATYYFTQANVPRARDKEKLKHEANLSGLLGHTYENVNQALEKATKESKPGDLILITGSTFVVAEIDGL